MTQRLFLRLAEDELHGPEAHVPAGTLRSYRPSAGVQAHVSHLQVYRETFAPGDEVVERVLPDGALRIVVHLGESTHGVGAAVVGASAQPAMVRLGGHMHGLSITLRPGAASAVLGVPVGELDGHAIDLRELWGADGADLPQRLAELPSDAARARCVDEALQRRLARARSPSRASAAGHALRLLAAANGRLSLGEVARAAGVGERRLQQLFRAEVGLSPRTWARLLRLHGCLRHLRDQPAPRWADVAIDCGYSDQSHLVNEFQALCGLTPSAYWRTAISGSSKTAA
jgi:AraC-like DNA-binding protein